MSKVLTTVFCLGIAASLNAANYNQDSFSQPTATTTTTSSDAAQMREQKKYPKDTAATSADEQLNIKIRDKVSNGILWDSYKEVSLNTANGVVTLAGFISTPEEQQKLMNQIQKIEGVKSVKSSLQFKKF